MYTHTHHTTEAGGRRVHVHVRTHTHTTQLRQEGGGDMYTHTHTTQLRQEGEGYM